MDKLSMNNVDRGKNILGDFKIPLKLCFCIIFPWILTSDIK